MYNNLSEFILRLEKEGELVRVVAPVDPVLEIAEITDRMAKSPDGGKALLFENTGTDFPVLTNMMGSDRRIAMALGVESLDDIATRLWDIFGKVLSPKENLGDKMRMLPLLGEVAKWLPKTSRRRGECQRVILCGEEAKLSLLPILKCWTHDGGRFVTLPLVNTIDPDSGIRNVGMYRMQVTGEHTTGMHWHLHKTGERHYRAYQRLGKRMPVSVCIGGDPVYTYAATAPMPDNMDEYLLAGFLRRKAVKLVRCITNDIYVPADCDFVIEGYIDTSQPKFTEGPFGDHTGFYSLEDEYPEFHVTAITHRKNAVYPATVVGIPPQEDLYISKATEKIFLTPIRLIIQPEIADLYMPAAGVAHNLALVSIHKTYDGQAFKVAGSMWGAGQMMFNKIMLVASAEDDIRDTETLARLVRSADLNEDVMFARGVLDVLDHATPTPGSGKKIALDLTVARPEKQVTVPENLSLPEWAAEADVTLLQKWGSVILRCDRAVDIDGVGFLKNNDIEGLNFLLIADMDTTKLSPEELLWHTAGNTDPGRDISMYGSTMIIDGRTKAPFREGYPARVPNVVTSGHSTRALVDSRWDEYKLGDFLSSPSLRFEDLVYSDRAEVWLDYQ